MFNPQLHQKYHNVLPEMHKIFVPFMDNSIQGRWNERDAIYHSESDKFAHAGLWE